MTGITTSIPTPVPASFGGTGVSATGNNNVFAGPTTGGPLPPSFRALVASDIPALGYASLAANTFSGNQTAPQFVSSIASGTAAFVIASSTQIANLNATLLQGANWASPLALGTTAPSTANLLGITLNNAPFIQTGPPIIASGFGTSPAIAHSSRSACTVLTIGTGGTASSGILTYPPAVNSWIISANNLTSNSSLVVAKTAGSATSVTLTSYSRTTGLVTAFNAGDVIEIMAFGS